mmetsp:Transcript_37199/g.97791  ORF Transcript_37199/g.97791 Transcript_37199/m.97791 type:complete len:103 (+) Transcript_37199:2-310(+)
MLEQIECMTKRHVDWKFRLILHSQELCKLGRMGAPNGKGNWCTQSGNSLRYVEEALSPRPSSLTDVIGDPVEHYMMRMRVQLEGRLVCVVVQVAPTPQASGA